LRDSREDRQIEEMRLRALEQQQRQQLSRTKVRAKVTGNKISRAKLSETQLTNFIVALEAERKREEAARPAAAPARRSSTIRTTDYGKLDWPVDGSLLYTFGRDVLSNNTSIRWNGVGIRAAAGTAVKSVSAGTVATVRQYGTYGLTVIVEHGGGDYSIYGSLSRADVKEKQTVAKGHILGTVGVADPDLPPHLHFEIRHGRGEAIDPVTWLRRK